MTDVNADARTSPDDLAADVLALLRDLVAVDSVNPSLVPGSAGESGIADHLQRWAAENDLPVERLEATAGRPSVLIRSRAAGGGPTLMLCGHTDTVGTGRMTDPLAPTVDGDRLYGRGAYDMKAGLAAALVAAREASRLGLAGEVVVAAVADEEHASLGVQEVLRHLRPDAAIVPEPTELAVATSHRGFVWTEIEVIGVAAHGSRPHLGKDAILKTGPILLALSDLNQRLRDRTHPRLGRGFVHGGLISGGREVSTIPDRCILTIERRTLPGETLQDVERDIDDLLATCRTADPELETRSRTTLARPPFEIPDEDSFVHTVADAVTTTLGRPAELAGVSYWADASLIADAGIPTVLFGPPGDGAHADVEWVSVTGTVDCARALVAVAQAFCGGAAS
jgi:acetylornithine deacetylase